MPSQTSPRAYPFPLDTDPINVAGDIAKLAQKIDDDVTNSLALKLSTTGGTITGGLTVNGNSHVKGTFTADGATTINDRLSVRSPTSYGIYVSNASNVPGIHFHHFISGEALASIRCASGDLYIDGDNDVYFHANNVPAMALVGTNPFLLIGKTTVNSDLAGWEIYARGEGLGRATGTASHKNSYSNLILRHVGGSAGMDADGHLFALFQRATPTPVSIGSIVQAGTSGVKYNTTCDYRLKDDLGPIDDPVGRVMALLPKKLRSKSDLVEFDGFIAHEVDPVAPYAVTGEKDAVYPDDHEFDPGGIDPQQLDQMRLVALLTAALQDALTRIAALEAAV